MSWSESDYRAAGYRTVKLRLPADTGKALDFLLKHSKVGRGALISQLILDAYKKSTSGRKIVSE